MDFNNTTTKDGLIQNCESLSRLGDTGITGNAILLAKFTGYLNQAWDKVATEILRVDKNWRWDDSNYDDPNGQPIGTATLETGVRGIILPRATNSADKSTLWKVYRVRCKDLNGDWYDLQPLGSGETEFDNGSGKPTKYRLVGNVLRFSDIPLTGSITLTDGVQVWFQRAFIRFTTSDTTKHPSFISGYHYLLPLDASATYMLPIDPALADAYTARFLAGLDRLKDTYATRNDDPNANKRMTAKIEDTK